jgi:hypothetical protein
MPTCIPDGPHLVVTKILGKPSKPRKTFTLCGFAQGNDYGVYNNTLAAMERAIKERVFYVDYGNGFVTPHVPTEDAFVETMKEIEERFKNLVQYTAVWTMEQFVGTYNGRRRTIYENALTSLRRKPISRKDSYVHAFVKAEKYNFTKKMNPAPRIIQPRDPRYIVESGRYIKPIEKKIYKHLNTIYGSIAMFKGLNLDQRGKVLYSHWSSFNKPVAVGLDAKRFDQHVSYQALSWEHKIYQMFYPNNKHFGTLLAWQRKNKCFARNDEGKVKYQTHGKRMSGDTNTALGNCLLMGSLIWTYARRSGVNIRLANDGDDCVVIMEQGDLEKFNGGLNRFFRNHGFELTMEKPVLVFEEIEFCQCHPVYDGVGYIMVRDPRVAISKDCVSLKPLDNTSIFKMWCSAVGQGGMSLTGGIPVWQNFYARLIQISDGAKALEDPTLMTGMKIMGRGMYRRYVQPTPEARLSFWLAFRISPEEQLCLEEYYDSMLFSLDGKSPRFAILPLH